MRILVTGAAGMLGTDVEAAVRDAGHEAIPLARATLDITDPDEVTEALTDLRPGVVINCAAYTNVDGAEADEAAALAVNGEGAGNLAQAAAGTGAWIVHVSTDYVFDGTKPEAYLESDAVAPQSAYGRTKLAGERAVAAAAPASHTIVRSSWLFGAGGPCFPQTILRLAAEREEIRVVADQIGCPTYTAHLAPALVTLGTAARLAGVVHVAGAGRCSWYEFAREIVTAAGRECAVVACRTEEFPRPARRPAFSVLASERGRAVPRLPAWELGLAEFLETEASRA
jgi:dTDP-4-dehydrorhamnose reductase